VRSFLLGAKTWPDPKAITLLFFSSVILFGQLEAETLYSVDGPVYALIGKELAAKSFEEWAALTWHGAPFFEHPHLTPWILGLFQKLFGSGSVSVLLPILLMSLGSVFVTYRIGLLLVSREFGLLCGTVLALTPQFVKDARSPMLEQTLMLTTALAILFHLLWWKKRQTGQSLLCGLMVALGLLAKGPPGLLAP
jgi:4-amino-4-deoxy-L-arabinose transferase-like glycosyltransferase